VAAPFALSGNAAEPDNAILHADSKDRLPPESRQL